MVECPESIEELEELEKRLPLCRKELLAQAQARLDAGTAKSEREATRQLAEETGRKPETIRKAIQREKLGTVSPLGNFRSKVLESDCPVLVFFTGPGCPACTALTPVLDGLVDGYSESIRFLECDYQDQPEVFDKYKIRGVPKLAIFADGKPHWLASRDKEKVVAALDEFVTTGKLSLDKAEVSRAVSRELYGLKTEPPELNAEEVAQVKSALSLVKETLLKLPIIADRKKYHGESQIQLDGAKRGFYRGLGEYPGNPTPEQLLVWETHFLFIEVAKLAGYFSPIHNYLQEHLPEELPENWSKDRKEAEKYRE